MFLKIRNYPSTSSKEENCLRCQFSWGFCALPWGFFTVRLWGLIQDRESHGETVRIGRFVFFSQTLLHLLFYYDNGIPREILRNSLQPPNLFSILESSFCLKLFKIYQFFFEVRILATTVRVSVFQTMIYFKANVKKYNKTSFLNKIILFLLLLLKVNASIQVFMPV